MEKAIEEMWTMLASLPVGYMFNYPFSDLPENFIEVSGQKMLKQDYMDLYEIMRGNVIESDEHFTLPTASSLIDLFDTTETPHKIIIKCR